PAIRATTVGRTTPASGVLRRVAMDGSPRAIEVLMVEDNPGDVRLTREALKGAKVWNQVHVVEDGVAALDYLYRRPPYEALRRPDLILLDLNLPRMDGREVLAIVKSDPTLKLIPIVVLTTSQAEE